MREDIARDLAAIKLSRPVAPEQSGAVRALYLPFHETEPYRDLDVTRDERYGPDERNRLDIFRPRAAGALRPVVLFVHGGAYIGGDKRTPGTPYHDNVGVWAARNGFIGITMTYRLAPAHPYPAGAADVGAAIAWLHQHAASFGGDPEAITLLGHSAGATHVACYGARSDLHAKPGGGVNGIVVMAGSYEFSDPDPSKPALAYFGSDPALREAASCITGFAASGIPAMIGISEHDAPDTHRQAWLLSQALFERDGCCPNFVYLPGHNHISQMSHLNAAGIGDTMLSDRLLDFVTACVRQSARAIPA
jgi:acetyl esterase/lipase